MDIGKLFISLGITGTDKTLKGIIQVKDGLKQTSSMALETKAAILGTVYVLERLFSASFQRANTLVNFSEMLGMSTKTLQEYQYAAQQVGATNEEMNSSFAGIQNTLRGIKWNEGVPKYLARLQMITGLPLSKEDIPKYEQHPEEFLKNVLQPYAQKETDLAQLRATLSEMGISNNIALAAKRNLFRPEIFRQANTTGHVVSDSALKANEQNRQKLSNLSTKMMADWDKFIGSERGSKFIESVIGLANAVERLVAALGDLQDKYDVIGKITGTIDLFSLVLGGKPSAKLKAQTEARYGKDAGYWDYIKTLDQNLNNYTPEDYSPTNLGEKIKEKLKLSPENSGKIDAIENAIKKPIDFLKGLQEQSQLRHDAAKKSIAPTASPLPAGGNKKEVSQSNSFNQTFNFTAQEGLNPKAMADDFKTAVNSALRQSYALVQVC